MAKFPQTLQSPTVPPPPSPPPFLPPTLHTPIPLPSTRGQGQARASLARSEDWVRGGAQTPNQRHTKHQ